MRASSSYTFSLSATATTCMRGAYNGTRSIEKGTVLCSYGVHMDTTVETPVRAERSSSRKELIAGAFFVLGVLLSLRLSRPEGFTGYLISGSAAAHGLDPYGVYPEVSSSKVVFRGALHAIPDINMNPPCVIPLFQGLAHLGLKGFAAVWTVISALCFVGAVYLVLRIRPDLSGRKLAFLCLCAAVFDTALSGQIYFFLMLLAAIGIVGLEQRRELMASVGIGLLVAVKPTFATWILFAAAAGRWRLALRSLAVTAALWLAAWATYGSGVYASWFRALRNDGHWMEPTDIAIAAWISRLANQRIGLVVAGLCVIALVVAIHRLKPPALVVAGLGLTAGILFTPLGWAAYTIVVAPVFVATKWGRFAKTGAVLLAIPVLVIVILVPNPNGAILVAGVVYTAGLAFVLAHFIAAAASPLKVVEI